MKCFFLFVSIFIFSSNHLFGMFALRILKMGSDKKIGFHKKVGLNSPRNYASHPLENHALVLELNACADLVELQREHNFFNDAMADRCADEIKYCKKDTLFSFEKYSFDNRILTASNRIVQAHQAMTYISVASKILVTPFSNAFELPESSAYNFLEKWTNQLSKRLLAADPIKDVYSHLKSNDDKIHDALLAQLCLKVLRLSYIANESPNRDLTHLFQDEHKRYKQFLIDWYLKNDPESLDKNNNDLGKKTNDDNCALTMIGSAGMPFC
jgi:hypothetical protein